MIAIGIIEYSKSDNKPLQMVSFIEYFGEETYAGFKKFPLIHIGKCEKLFNESCNSKPKNVKDLGEYDEKFKIFFIVEHVVIQHSAIKNETKKYVCDTISKFSNAGIVINEAYINNFRHATNCTSPVYPTVPEYFENDFDNECANAILENNKNIDLFDIIYNTIPVDVLEDCSSPYKSLTKYMILNDHEFAVIEADYTLEETYIVQHNINGKNMEDK